MAAETEVERLVTRLVGDSVSLQRAMREGVHSVEQGAKEIEHHTDGIRAATVALGLLAVEALNKMVEKFRELGHEALSAFEAHEDAEVKLRAAIEASGHAVESTFEAYEGFAGRVSKTTTISKVATLELLQTAESYGLTGAAAERAAKNAIAMEGALGRNAHGSLRLTAALEQGSAQMLGRFLPAIRGIKDPVQQAAKAQELLGRMFKIAEAAAGTTSGQFTQLHKSVHALMAEIGESVSKVLMPFITAMRRAVDWIKELNPAVRNLAIGVAGLTIAFTALKVAMSFESVAKILRVVGGYVALLVNPVKLAVAVASALAAAFTAIFTPINVAVGAVVLLGVAAVEAFGGIKAVVAGVSDFLGEVSEFLQPLGAEIVATFKSAVAAVKGFLSSLWEYAREKLDLSLQFAVMSAAAKTAFKFLRDSAISALIAVEYAFTNWRTVAELTFSYVAYLGAKWGNQLTYLLAVVLPIEVGNFATKFKTAFDIMAREAGILLIKNLGEPFAKIEEWVVYVIARAQLSGAEAANMAAKLAGDVVRATFAGLTAQAEADVKKLTEGLPGKLAAVPERIVGPMEKMLGSVWTGALFKLGVGWPAFWKKRWTELGGGAKEAGDKLSDPIVAAAEKVKKAIDLKDAMRVGSSEWFDFLNKQLNNLAGPANVAEQAIQGVAKAHRAVGGGGSGTQVQAIPPWARGFPQGIGAAGGAALARAAGLPEPGEVPDTNVGARIAAQAGDLGIASGAATGGSAGVLGTISGHLAKLVELNRNDKGVRVKPLGLGRGGL